MSAETGDLERVVLGICMLGEPESMVAAASLEASDFTDHRHAAIFEVISVASSAGKPHTEALVWAELLATGKGAAAGGAEYVLGLTEAAPIATNARHHVAALKRFTLARGLYREARRFATAVEADHSDPESIGQAHLDAVAAILSQSSDDGTLTPERFVRRYFGELDARRGAPPMTTGIQRLDDVLVGLGAGHLVVVGARPSMGKSALAWQLFERAVSLNRPPLLFSVEMSCADLGDRKTLTLANCRARDLAMARLSPAQMSSATQGWGDFARGRWLVNAESPMSIERIRAIARRWHHSYGLGLIVVDYLQLVAGSKRASSREQEVTGISGGLKSLGKELGVPVVAVCQLNRAPDARPDHRPKKSDLRESGSIEQDADAILLLYRPSYYDETADPSECEIIVAKQRNGGTGVAPVEFKGGEPAVHVGRGAAAAAAWAAEGQTAMLGRARREKPV